MEKRDDIPNFDHIHLTTTTDAVEVRADGRVVEEKTAIAAICGAENLSQEDSKRIVLGALGIRDENREGRNPNGRSYGFSKWDGCKWVPRGPKGANAQTPADPSMN